MKKYIISALIIGSLLLIVGVVSVYAEKKLSFDALNGRFLTVENGLCYLNPVNKEIYHIDSPETAVRLIRRISLGIKNGLIREIETMPFSFNLFERDADSDGLPDVFEDAIGTDKGNKDSDRDGYSDKIEVDNGYDPMGNGKFRANSGLTSKLSGRLLLQAESRGEAWYLNPWDGKKYYLGKADTAFTIFKILSINANESDIAEYAVNSEFARVGVWQETDLTDVSDGKEFEEILNTLEGDLAANIDPAAADSQSAEETADKSDDEAECDNEECFLKNFSRCDKSSFDMVIPGGMTMTYEMIGPSDGLCRVKVKSANMPLKEMNGLEMTCLVNYEEDFYVEINNTGNCTGPLAEIINKASRGSTLLK